MEKETENTPDIRHTSQMMDTVNATYTQVLHVQHLLDTSTLPTWVTPQAAGLDLHSAKDIMIAPGELMKVPTDLAIKPLPGTYGQILSQSGLVTKYNIEVKAGTIDADYTGNVTVLFGKCGTFLL